MPKLEAASLTIKISLAQLTDTGNIREATKYGPNEKGEYPQEIIDLATSIKTLGQLQPVNVKFFGEVDGAKQYELIAGFRRRAAFQYLCSIGEDFNQIEARVVTGEKLTIQLVENIQREDLTAQEREAAIFQLAETGMKQKEIAAQLSKNSAYVSVNISAYKIRQKAQNAGISLSGVETSTLAEFLSVPDDELPSILQQLSGLGGTRAAASLLAAKFKRGKEMPPQQTPATAAPVAPPEKSNTGTLKTGGEIPAKTHEPPQTKPAAIKPPPRDEEPIEAEHREIDANIVLTVIYDYIKSVEKELREHGFGTSREPKLTTQINAAKVILALIHERLDNA